MAAKSTIKTLEDSVEKLEQELDTKKTDKLQYKSDAVLVHTIRTKATEEGEILITGLTILDKELFVVRKACSDVEVYETIEFRFTRRWNLKELIHPLDIGSCERNRPKCLYIGDSKHDGQSSEIFRVEPNGKIIKKWSTGDDWGYGLSVTDESNVILTVNWKSKLIEYSPDGQLILEINISSDVGICRPLHAIKLSNGHFVVCYSSFDAEQHEVCVVDADGKLMKSFCENRGSDVGQMWFPMHLSVDVNGFVMVADHDNGRVLLLDPDLKFRREILSKDGKHGLQLPSKILLEEPDGRLFVADERYESEKKIWTGGRILIFDFK